MVISRKSTLCNNMTMEKYALSHLEELYERSDSRNIISASLFYSEEEIDEALNYLKGHFGKAFAMDNIHLLGGHKDADRKRIIFSPFEVNEKDYVEAMLIETRNIVFEGFSHREILGALMGLGIKRSLIGDIVIADKKAYVFFASESEEMILSLDKVGRENVKASSIEIDQVPFVNRNEIRSISVASTRLDALLARVFSITREEAKDSISKGLVKVGQEPNYKNDYIPKEGERISLKGHGKFRFLGEKGTSKKGKTIVDVEIYL